MVAIARRSRHVLLAAVLLAGTRLDPTTFLAYCDGPQAGTDCTLIHGLAPANIPDLPEATRSDRDPRIRAVVALDAGHFVFLPVCTLPGRLIASQVCVDPNPAVDRAEVHTMAAAEIVRFLDRALGTRPIPPRDGRQRSRRSA